VSWHPPSALTGGLLGFVVGGSIAGVSDVLTLVALITGLSAATAREAAVLADRSEADVKRAAAIGFFSGLLICLLALGFGGLRA
jgi:hypothetical protein